MQRRILMMLTGFCSSRTWKKVVAVIGRSTFDDSDVSEARKAGGRLGIHVWHECINCVSGCFRSG